MNSGENVNPKEETQLEKYLQGNIVHTSFFLPSPPLAVLLPALSQDHATVNVFDLTLISRARCLSLSLSGVQMLIQLPVTGSA